MVVIVGAGVITAVGELVVVSEVVVGSLQPHQPGVSQVVVDEVVVVEVVVVVGSLQPNQPGYYTVSSKTFISLLGRNTYSFTSRGRCRGGGSRRSCCNIRCRGLIQTSPPSRSLACFGPGLRGGGGGGTRLGCGGCL
jgi:hypothetical protein